MLYSKSTGGFYDLEIHGGSVPTDAVEITQENYVTLMKGQSIGKKIIPDEDGFPILSDIPVVDFKVDKVTLRQAKLALLKAGFYTPIDTAIQTMPGDDGIAARIEWEYASSVDRSSPLVAMLTAQMDMTAEQLDDLFTLAASL